METNIVEFILGEIVQFKKDKKNYVSKIIPRNKYNPHIPIHDMLKDLYVRMEVLEKEYDYSRQKEESINLHSEAKLAIMLHRKFCKADHTCDRGCCIDDSRCIDDYYKLSKTLLNRSHMEDIKIILDKLDEEV